MAMTRSNSGLDVVFDAGRTFFQQKMDQMRKAQAKRKVFRVTYNELSSLCPHRLDRSTRDDRSDAPHVILPEISKYHRLYVEYGSVLLIKQYIGLYVEPNNETSV